ncbi:MAG: hypothetical protein KAJ16_10980 [Calditrichia bacterium]|nr:hypothetical protein [Calditrichia bacterium]MCK5454879.1 hypothetical protein [Calditrichia bacterium]
MKIFIDEIAWLAVADDTHESHASIKEQFKYYLDGGHSFYTTNIIVGNVISKIKENQNFDSAVKYSEILEDAWLGTHLHYLWIGRRTQKDAIRLFKKFPDIPLSIFDFANVVLMNRRNIRFIITTNTAYSTMGFKIVPE